MADPDYKDQPPDGLYASEALTREQRRTYRRRRAMVGIGGLAVLLGGVFFVRGMTSTDVIVGDPSALVSPTPLSAPSPFTLAPSSVAPTFVEPSLAMSPTVARSEVPVSRSASPSPSPSSPRLSKSVAKRIAAARASAAADGFPLQRPLTGKPHVGVAGPVTTTNTGSLEGGGSTLRVVSARYDLTGQRELALAADDGEPFGIARCTQKFHFSSDGPVLVRPTMLLCWRTSATKSVITVAVTKQGSPSRSASVDAIDMAWSKLP